MDSVITLVAYLALSSGLAWLSIVLWRKPWPHHTYKTAAFSLCVMAIACVTHGINATVGLATLASTDAGIMSQNIALYVGLPMAVLTLIDHTYSWHWKKATWGRIFLGLAAMFELTRRGEVGTHYGETITIVAPLILLYLLYSLRLNNSTKPQLSLKSSLALSLSLVFLALGAYLSTSYGAIASHGIALISLGSYLYLAA